MDYVYWILTIAVGGIVVAYMSVRKAMLLGMVSTWLSLFMLFIFLLSQIKEKFYFVRELLKYNGLIMATLGILGWYILLLWKNDDYITNNKMPDNWYLFSYFILVALLGIITSIIMYLKNNNPLLQIFGWILYFSLVGFIIIETIIGTYYRTDGFTI
jgi:hypothetical protein